MRIPREVQDILWGLVFIAAIIFLGVVVIGPSLFEHLDEKLLMHYLNQ